jgi:lambda family phage portal protein
VRLPPLLRRMIDSRFGARSLEAAETNRLNSAHWQNAKGRPFNLGVMGDLRTVQDRAIYEAENNPTVAGVIETHAVDLIGPEGPTLQILGDERSAGYRDALERVWWDWWQNPDINGQLSGAEIMRQWVKMLWKCGDALTQLATVDSPFIGLRMLSIDPRRLQTPPGKLADPRTMMGVERNETGRPVAFHILEDQDKVTGAFGLNFKRITANSIIHLFRIDNPGQARGLPWLTPSLDSVAELRDFDAATLQAARTAADFAAILFNRTPDAAPTDIAAAGTSVPFNRGEITVAPNGYELAQMKAEHPHTNYVAFRQERQADIGRAVNMPLMMVRLDSRQHNYSSARFDGQLYLRGNKAIQGWLARAALNRLVDRVRIEAQFKGLIPPRMPAGIRYEWVWPAPPYVNPKDEAEGLAKLLELNVITLEQACAQSGTDWEENVAQREVEYKRLKAAGLPTSPAAAAATAAKEAEEAHNNPDTNEEDRQWPAAANNAA